MDLSLGLCKLALLLALSALAQGAGEGGGGKTPPLVVSYFSESHQWIKDAPIRTVFFVATDAAAEDGAELLRAIEDSARAPGQHPARRHPRQGKEPSEALLRRRGPPTRLLHGEPNHGSVRAAPRRLRREGARGLGRDGARLCA